MSQELGATEKELIENRIAKLHLLENLGVSAYPSKSERDTLLAEVRGQQDELVESKKEITIAGRIIAKRGHGKLFFLDIVDESGKLQAVLRADLLDEKNFEIATLIEVGDFLQISGTIFVTNAGELSIEGHGVKLLAKATRPLPEKWFTKRPNFGSQLVIS
ncbi:MAG: OB-fold nucleic acid binding domain-containing protein [Candidatus Berkelbacteria bacterium]|nr:OB-fold nucleic acid binding domain-containing protein [Candidatus Berkelbacteria bacterium]